MTKVRAKRELRCRSIANVNEVDLRPDPRWRSFVTDLSALECRVCSWPVSEAVPGGVAEVLRVSRELFVHSYFVYEFSLTAVVWGLLALEASLRVCLEADDRESLHGLIRRARDRGVLTADETDVLDGARGLRNKIVHGSLLPTFAPSAAAKMLEGLHEAISDVCERTASEHQPGEESAYS